MTLLGQRHRLLATGALCLCAILLLATGSRASVLAAVLTVAATLLLLAARHWRRHARTILTTGTAAALLVPTVLLTTSSGLAFLERSETFTGRTHIWKAVAVTAMEAPWVGRGYGAFWTSAAGDAAWKRSAIPDRIIHAHNGALDVFAELGAVGIALVFVPLAWVAVAALRHALASPSPGCLWPAVYLVFFMASNVAESWLFRHKLFWALYVAVACHVATAPRKPLH